jgi:molybdate transport system substrate-binding protein
MVVFTVQPRRVARNAAGAIGVLVLLARLTGAERKPELVIAAAANLTDAFRSLGPKFEAETGIHPVFSFASTAQLTQQIENSAPFDLFAAADAAHIDQLDRKGLLLPGSRAVFAQGVVALWIPPGSKAPVKRIEDLAGPEVRVIAIAKPELAPYGEAAIQALKSLGIWERIKSRAVYAENINMAKQYGASGNADAVFTAYALVMHAGGTLVPVDPGLYPPIDQTAGILASAAHPDAARKFVTFLLRGGGRAVLEQYGYRQAAKRLN